MKLLACVVVVCALGACRRVETAPVVASAAPNDAVMSDAARAEMIAEATRIFGVFQGEATFGSVWVGVFSSSDRFWTVRTTTNAATTIAHAEITTHYEPKPELEPFVPGDFFDKKRLAHAKSPWLRRAVFTEDRMLRFYSGRVTVIYRCTVEPPESVSNGHVTFDWPPL